MKSNKIDMPLFCLKYNAIRKSLSSYSCTMIETFINFFGSRVKNVNNIYLKEKILNDLDNIYIKLNKTSNEKLKEDLIRLKEMVSSNENYFDLYIKLQLVLGLYPDSFFFNLSYDYFYREIYSKIMRDEFVDEYAFVKQKNMI